MGKKYTAVFIITMLTVVSLIQIESNSTSSDPSENYIEELLASNEFKIDDISTISEETLENTKIAVIRECSSYDNDLLISVINNGIPVISIGHSSQLFKDLGLNRGFSSTSTNLGYFINPVTKQTICYSASMYSAKDSIESLIQWANECYINKEESLRTGESGISWGSEYIYLLTIENYQGRMNIRNIYTEQDVPDSDYRYFKVNYQLQNVPKTNGRNADSKVWVDVDENNSSSMILDYAPTTTSNSSSHTVGLNWNVTYTVSTGGVGIEYTQGCSESWTYNMQDVSVYDNSDYSLEFFSIWNDIDQDKAVGSNTYTAKPGQIIRTVKTTDNGSLDLNENYGAGFCTWGKNHFWENDHCINFTWTYDDLEIYIA